MNTRNGCSAAHTVVISDQCTTQQRNRPQTQRTRKFTTSQPVDSLTAAVLGQPANPQLEIHFRSLIYLNSNISFHFWEYLARAGNSFEIEEIRGRLTYTADNTWIWWLTVWLQDLSRIRDSFFEGDWNIIPAIEMITLKDDDPIWWLGSSFRLKSSQLSNRASQHANKVKT